MARDQVGKMSGISERFIEKMEPRNTRYNETVRANNKRLDRGESPKAFPRGKAASKRWKPSKRSQR